MLIALILIPLTSLALPLTASSPKHKNTVQCVHVPNVPPASIVDCTNLLRVLGHEAPFHESVTYISGDVIDEGVGSCHFSLRGRYPTSGMSERIKMVEYFPALQRISLECLETPEGYAGGKIPVGEFFVAGLGADGVLGSVANITAGRGIY